MTDKSYVVQTNTSVIERCVLMTTEPGDLVLDPTCGSGTTAYVAEAMGTPLDHNRYQPRPACSRSPAPAHCDVSLLPTKGRGARAGRWLRLQAQAKQQERGGRRNRSTRHARIDRQRTSHRRKRSWSTGPDVTNGITRVIGSILRRGNDPHPSRLRCRRYISERR